MWKTYDLELYDWNGQMFTETSVKARNEQEAHRKAQKIVEKESKYSVVVKYNLTENI